MISSIPPTIHPRLQKAAALFLRLSGWCIEGEVPQLSKFIIIGAPHTSNWDFVYMLALLGQIGLRVNWLGKDALFRWPYGWFMTKLGGIPIDRSKRNNVVEQVAQVFATHEKLVIGLLPEGTRRKRNHWKTGFYYMAQAADVPILLCAVDYGRQVATIGPLIQPETGLAEVMNIIRNFMAGVQGKHPEKFSDIRLRPMVEDEVLSLQIEDTTN